MTKRNLPFLGLVFLLSLITISPTTSAQSGLAVQSFEQLWDHFNQHYPSFQAKGIDWHEQYELFRPKVHDQMSDEALFTVMSEMLATLNDPQISLQSSHAQFHGNANSTFASTFSTPLLHRQWEENQVRSLRKEGFDLPTMILGEDGHPVLSYSLSGRYAYLRVHRFEGLSPAKMKKSIQTILSEIAKQEGLILDVRCNPGGSTKLAYMIANYFADQKRVGHYEQHKPMQANHAKGLEPRLLTPPSKGPSFTSTILLLTNEETQAAAEVFTLAMRRLPHVTTLGTHTQGIFSGQTVLSLTNGWICHVPYQKHFSANIISYEGRGLPVDLRATSTLEDLDRKMDCGIQKALNELRGFYMSKSYDLEVK